MTHAEALAGDRHGFPGHDCPGTLVPTGTYSVSGGSLMGVRVEVATYRCDACGHALSIEFGGRVLNCYPVPARVPDLVRALAARLDAGPHLPAPPVE